MKGKFTWREPRSRFEKPTPKRCHLMVAAPVTAEDDRDVYSIASLIGAAMAVNERPVLLAESHAARRRMSGFYSTSLSRSVAEMVKARFPDLNPVTRGPVCHLSLPPGLSQNAAMLDELLEILPTKGLCLVVTGPAELRELVDGPSVNPDSVLLVSDLAKQRALTALACEDLSRRGIRCRVWKKPLQGMRARLAASLFFADRETVDAVERLLTGLGLGGRGSNAV